MSSTKSVIEKILSSSVDKLSRSNKPVPSKEALKLYRDILKFSRKIDWTTQDGAPWRPIIMKSAREEFELARDEKDPVLLMKMMLASRESMRKLSDKINNKVHTINNQIHDSRTDVAKENLNEGIFKHMQ